MIKFAEYLIIFNLNILQIFVTFLKKHKFFYENKFQLSIFTQVKNLIFLSFFLIHNHYFFLFFFQFLNLEI